MLRINVYFVSTVTFYGAFEFTNFDVYFS